MATNLQKYGIDPADINAGTDFFIAQARGLTTPKASEYKTFKPDQGIYRAGPAGMEVVREPQIGASAGKPPAGYRYSQDGTSLEAIPGGPATKLPGEMAGRMAALQTARRTMEDAKAFYENLSTGDRANQLLNRGEAGQAERTIGLAVEAALRAMTGAAAPENEVRTYMNMFAPSFDDSQATIKDKLQRLESFMADVETNVNQGRSTGPAPAAAPQQSAPSQLLQIRTQQERDALPPGTKYIAPDGSERTKQ
jgi:hypothetical protein